MKEKMKEGEIFLLYGDEKANYLIKYEKNKEIHTHKGKIVLPEKLFYGDKIISSKNFPFYVLYPDTSYLSMKVKRKTTIVYPKDAGFIILNLGIKSGDKVLEVGTGSGAFTIILSNAVGENGIVYSFERRKDFLENAKENFEKFSKFKNVIFYNMDLEKEILENIEVDAVFIDVPEPWKLITNLKKLLKSGKGLASISPNIEQIKKTKEKLIEEKFVRIRICEIILREMLVREEGTRPKEYSITHTGYLIFANKVNE